MQDTTERPQSQGEEIANGVSHGVALLAAIAAVPLAKQVPQLCLELLVAGGVAYTPGIVFFMWFPATAMPTRYGTALSWPAPVTITSPC